MEHHSGCLQNWRSISPNTCSAADRGLRLPARWRNGLTQRACCIQGTKAQPHIPHGATGEGFLTCRPPVGLAKACIGSAVWFKYAWTWLLPGPDPKDTLKHLHPILPFPVSFLPCPQSHTQFFYYSECQKGALPQGFKYPSIETQTQTQEGNNLLFPPTHPKESQQA